MRDEARFLVVVCALYAGIGIAYLVFPIAGEFDRVLLGGALLPTDVLLSSGILEWGFRSLRSPALHIFDWNAGFPLKNTLAATENFIGWQLFYTPLRAAGVGVAAAFNTLLLGSLAVSGAGAALLARRLGADRWGAAAAGFIFGYGPYHLNNIMHLQSMAVCWAPFAILFLDRYMESRRHRDAFALAGSVVLTMLSGMYFGIFLALVLPLYAILACAFGRFQWDRNLVARLGLVGLGSAAAITPLLLPYFRFASEHGVHRESLKAITRFSMEWTAIARTPAFQELWRNWLSWPVPWDGQPAFFGVVALALIAAAMVGSRKGKSPMAVASIIVSLSIICYLLALGPQFKTGGKGPSSVIDWVPMPGRLWLIVPGIRWPARIFFFAWLGGALLAGIGLTSLRTRIRSPLRNVFAAVVIVLLLVEYRPAAWLSGNSVRAGDPLTMSDSYPFLAAERDSGGIVEFPVWADRDGRDRLIARYIYGGSGHLRRHVALHGSRIPPLSDSLMRSVERLNSPESRELLSTHGVTRAIVHRLLGDSASNEKLVRTLTDEGYPMLFSSSESIVFDLSHHGDK